MRTRRSAVPILLAKIRHHGLVNLKESVLGIGCAGVGSNSCGGNDHRTVPGGGLVMHASDVPAVRRGFSRRYPVPLALIASACIGLSAGHALAGLSPGQACAVKKLKASEQAFKSAMKCEESLISGLPPDPCLQAAGERLTEVFQKLEAKGGCVTTHDDLPVRSLLEAAAVHIGILLPGNPPCTTPGQACGACGGGTQGTCLARFPNVPALNLGNACVVEESCSDIVCNDDSECPPKGGARRASRRVRPSKAGDAAAFVRDATTATRAPRTSGADPSVFT
jgi:hypothetical protein